jgi:hypothetical protein
MEPSPSNRLDLIGLGKLTLAADNPRAGGKWPSISDSRVEGGDFEKSARGRARLGLRRDEQTTRDRCYRCFLGERMGCRKEEFWLTVPDRTDEPVVGC